MASSGDFLRRSSSRLCRRQDWCGDDGLRASDGRRRAKAVGHARSIPRPTRGGSARGKVGRQGGVRKGRKRPTKPRFLSGIWSPRIKPKLCTRLGSGWAALAGLGISSSTLYAMNSEFQNF
uniref:Uncharacterized protein n=1 Tax=Oryza sativa subsp. japonica TaxID=39947 RepID=Q69WH9_ORYSJ|nr:hypothetical protein [Oryza sativa Japonica Group]BAD32960.1 hypothetical protein [Oryza sativa Japonica Group]